MPYLHVLNDATNYLFEYFSNKKLTKPNKIGMYVVDKKFVFKIWSLKKLR